MSALYCEVCYQGITGNNIIICVACGNDFHISCIDLGKIESCPMCKVKLWIFDKNRSDQISSSTYRSGYATSSTDDHSSQIPVSISSSGTDRIDYDHYRSGKYGFLMVFWGILIALSILSNNILFITITYFSLFGLVYYLRRNKPIEKEVVNVLAGILSLIALMLFYLGLAVTFYTHLILSFVASMMLEDIQV